MKKAPIRIAIADDHALLRQSLKSIFDSKLEYNVVIDASDGQELLQKLSEISVDVVLLDLEMPVMGGFEALKKISIQHPLVKCLILSYFNESDTIFSAMQWGAKGFIAKNCSIDTLETAISTICSGKLYFEKEFETLTQSHPGSTSYEAKPTHPFTNKEMAIIRLVCAGKTNKEIAKEFGIAVKTVENHRSNIFIKARVKNVAQLVVFAIQEGIIIAL
jgi:DNA-binding NarL/FixJ family response regulator